MQQKSAPKILKPDQNKITLSQFVTHVHRPVKIRFIKKKVFYLRFYGPGFLAFLATLELPADDTIKQNKIKVFLYYINV